MKLRLLSMKAVEYGFAPEIKIKNEDFHGHQIGLCIGVRDAKTNAVMHNNIPDDDFNDKFDKILEDKELLLLQDYISIREDDITKDGYIYYLPYYVVNHSVFQPTVNFDQVTHAYGYMNKVKVEVLFIDNSYNRYVTFDYEASEFCGHSCTLMDFISNCLEHEIVEMALEGKEFKYADKIDPEHNETYEGEIILDMYDKVGGRMQRAFENVKEVIDAISSVRIIGLDIEKINTGE